VGVEGNGGAAVAVAAAHDQVGDALQTGGLHLGCGHRVGFDFPAPGAQQFGGALGVGGVVAGRGVGGHAHQLLQKAHFVVKVGVDPLVESA
jgi:hypothetical protein